MGKKWGWWLGAFYCLLTLVADIGNTNKGIKETPRVRDEVNDLPPNGLAVSAGDSGDAVWVYGQQIDFSNEIVRRRVANL